MKKWLKNIKFKKLLLFILILFLVGFLFGIFYYFGIDRDTKESLMLNIITLKENLLIYRTNNILLHLGICLLLMVLSFVVIGLPFIYFYIFYEGLSIGFSFATLISVYRFRGIIFCLLHFIFYKLFYLIFIIFIILRCTRITKNLIGLIIYRGNAILKKNLSINIKKILVFLLFIFLYDVTIYFICLNINNLLIRFL